MLRGLGTEPTSYVAECECMSLGFCQRYLNEIKKIVSAKDAHEKTQIFIYKSKRNNMYQQYDYAFYEPVMILYVMSIFQLLHTNKRYSLS